MQKYHGTWYYFLDSEGTVGCSLRSAVWVGMPKNCICSSSNYVSLFRGFLFFDIQSTLIVFNSLQTYLVKDACLHLLVMLTVHTDVQYHLFHHATLLFNNTGQSSCACCYAWEGDLITILTAFLGSGDVFPLVNLGLVATYSSYNYGRVCKKLIGGSIDNVINRKGCVERSWSKV
jgi:hypothetical protein